MNVTRLSEIGLSPMEQPLPYSFLESQQSGVDGHDYRAREQPVQNGRTIVLVTDKPVYFVGGGAVTPKPREGYDVALLKFRMDDAGLGYDGTMAAAARLKVGTGGVEVDDYAEKPINLVTVTRAIK